MLALFYIILIINDASTKLVEVNKTHFQNNKVIESLEMKSKENFKYMVTSNKGTIDYYQHENKILTGKFIPFLLNTSVKIIECIENNIKNNYGLSSSEVQIIDKAFNSSKLDYYVTLKNNLKRLKNIDYKSEDLFLLDFTDFSNLLLQSLVESNLNKIEGNLNMPSQWYKHLLKYTILRQQTKIAVNLVELQICLKFSICVDKTKYSEYIIEWIRLLMNVDAIHLKQFFYAISDVFAKFHFTIKTTSIFREKIKESVHLSPLHQRNMLDLLDETLIERKTVQAVDPQLKELVILFREIFEIIDNNYDLNYVNGWKMNKLTRTFFKWTQNEDHDVKELVHRVFENMQYNIQIWPRNVIKKINNIWSNIVNKSVTIQL